MTIEYTPMKLLAKAVKFAAEKHKEQKDDTGKPYIVHPEQVFKILSSTTMDENLLCAAWLHDVVEDCEVKYEELVKEFNKDIADLVMEVTHEGEKDIRGRYFPRLKTQRGIMLKFADRLSNISRMEAWSDERKEHYLKRSTFWKKDNEQRERIALQRRGKGFCTCHECIEREYESVNAYGKMGEMVKEMAEKYKKEHENG